METAEPKLDPKLFHVDDAERLKIKLRTQQLIEQAGGPEVFQYRAGCQSALLSRYGSRSAPHMIRADVIVALDRELGAPLMLTELAAMVGYRLVPIESEPDDGREVGIRDVVDLNRADSDVSSNLADALEDGVIDIAERRQTRAAIARKVSKLMRVDRKLAGAR